MRRFVIVFAVVQLVLAIRVMHRFVRTAGGCRIERQVAALPTTERVSVLVPVLNEVDRLTPCLEGLIAQGEEVEEILVIDGGSSDGTQEIVLRFATQDRRVRLLDASPVPSECNGKAHGLEFGFDRSSGRTDWVLTIDADVRPDRHLVRSLLAHASTESVAALSVATLQTLSGRAEGLVHPAMLATLVYRYGIPGTATARVDRVQANGQCYLVRRGVLNKVGGFGVAANSVCEDVTLARAIAAAGFRVGIYETDGLVSVEMYTGWREAWDNWTRSLPMRDRSARLSTVVGLIEVMLVQALPLWLAPLLGRSYGRGHPAVVLNVALLSARFGVLAGMRRAYEQRPWTYWLSPLSDLAVAFKLCSMWRRRSHIWRGRAFVSGGAA